MGGVEVLEACVDAWQRGESALAATKMKEKTEDGGERTFMTLIPARINEQLSVKQQRLSRSGHFGRTAVVRSLRPSPPLLPLSHHLLQRWR